MLQIYALFHICNKLSRISLPYLLPFNVGLPLCVFQGNHPVISCYTDSSLFIKVRRLVDICAVCEIDNLLGVPV